MTQHKKRTKSVDFSNSFSKTETARQWSDPLKHKKTFKNLIKLITLCSGLNLSTKLKQSGTKFTHMLNLKKLMGNAWMVICWSACAKVTWNISTRVAYQMFKAHGFTCAEVKGLKLWINQLKCWKVYWTNWPKIHQICKISQLKSKGLHKLWWSNLKNVRWMLIKATPTCFRNLQSESMMNFLPLWEEKKREKFKRKWKSWKTKITV